MDGASGVAAGRAWRGGAGAAKLEGMMPAPSRPRPAARAATLALLAAVGVGAAGAVACNSDSVVSNNSGGISLGNPSYVLGIPTAVSVRQRATTILPVTIVRTDYTGPVFVTFTGLPKGVTAPTLSSTSTDAMSITLFADSTSVPGVTAVTVNSSGVDVASRTATFQLTVAANP
ncbi:MAG: hypothetical protein IT359_10300 [Gemmatimonadaceae bacterium]|nr:hypothetical protein [Gemmatimonadaceae bacterium]